MTTSTDERARLMETVRDVVTQILPGLPREQITGDRHLKDLGADSVDRVEIIGGLVGRLGLRTPMAVFSTVPDIDALVGLLARETRSEEERR